MPELADARMKWPVADRLRSDQGSMATSIAAPTTTAVTSARRTQVSAGRGDLQILYDDDSLIVVNKPAGLLAVPLAAQSTVASAYAHLGAYFRPRGKRTDGAHNLRLLVAGGHNRGNARKGGHSCSARCAAPGRVTLAVGPAAVCYYSRREKKS